MEKLIGTIFVSGVSVNPQSQVKEHIFAANRLFVLLSFDNSSVSYGRSWFCYLEIIMPLIETVLYSYIRCIFQEQVRFYIDRELRSVTFFLSGLIRVLSAFSMHAKRMIYIIYR